MLNNYLYSQITRNFPHQPTDEQHLALQKLADFLLSQESDLLFLLKGYAGTGKTSLIGALVKTMAELKQKSVLLAPTGRAAKVFSGWLTPSTRKSTGRKPSRTNPPDSCPLIISTKIHYLS